MNPADMNLDESGDAQLLGVMDNLDVDNSAMVVKDVKRNDGMLLLPESPISSQVPDLKNIV